MAERLGLNPGKSSLLPVFKTGASTAQPSLRKQGFIIKNI